MSIGIHAVLNRAAATADASSNSSVAAATHPNAASTRRHPLHRPRGSHLFIRTAPPHLLTLTTRINVTIAVARRLQAAASTPVIPRLRVAVIVGEVTAALAASGCKRHCSTGQPEVRVMRPRKICHALLRTSYPHAASAGGTGTCRRGEPATETSFRF